MAHTYFIYGIKKTFEGTIEDLDKKIAEDRITAIQEKEIQKQQFKQLTDTEKINKIAEKLGLQ